MARRGRGPPQLHLRGTLGRNGTAARSISSGPTGGRHDQPKYLRPLEALVDMSQVSHFLLVSGASVGSEYKVFALIPTPPVALSRSRDHGLHDLGGSTSGAMFP